MRFPSSLILFNNFIKKMSITLLKSANQRFFWILLIVSAIQVILLLIIEINECTSSTHDCHLMALCNNTKGSYSCSCKEGYKGDGRNCTGKFRIY